MKLRAWFLVTLLATAGLAVAADEKAGEVDMEAMMAEMAKLAKPGDHHAHLARTEGTWKAAVKFWMEPGAKPEVSEAKAKVRPILGGRFFQTTYAGRFMDKPFEGIGISGYDNSSKKHIDVWMDTMGTLMMVSEGNCEDGGNLVHLASEFQNPMTGSNEKMKTVTRFVDDDTMVFEMYHGDGQGKEFKTMEITYTRM